MLHITNGTSVQIPVPGDTLYWDDVLCEGPVLPLLPLEELSRVRERFLRRWSPGASLGERDRTLRRFRAHEEVVLWFEHDLYDQLQLLQLLDWFSRQDMGGTRLTSVFVDRYLGSMDSGELASLFPERRLVTAEQLRLGRGGWAAFTSSDPSAIEYLLLRDTGALPFLADALMRHLQRFPSVVNGLSRDERQILDTAATGDHDRISLFLASQKLEERIFMGDLPFFAYVDGLCDCAVPLLHLAADRYSITAAGVAVLRGEADHIALNGIDRWLGGVHLTAGAPVWRWDDSTRRLYLRNSS